MYNLNWVPFREVMPEAGRPIVYAMLDNGRGEAMQPDTHEALIEAGVEQDVIHDESPDAWLYFEIGVCAPDGFGLALYKAQGRGEKVDDYTHAALFENGMWIYLADLAGTLVPTIHKTPELEWLILEGELLDKSTIWEREDGKCHRILATWRGDKV